MRSAARQILLGGMFGAGRPAGNLLRDEMAGAAFDFINMDMVIRGGGLDWSGDPNNRLTNTSPPTQWVRNSAGVYVSGTTLRCDHLADGTALGLLPEGQFTNVLLRSQEFGNAAWTKTDTTVTANATAAPDGTVTADLLTEGTAGTGAIQQFGIATSASVPMCGAIFLKPSANNDWVRVRLSDSVPTAGVDAWLNLSTGALGTVAAVATATSVGAQVNAAANGFYRVEVWATFPAAVSGARLAVISATANGGTTRVNNAAYYAWQADAGLGARPSSPIVTTSAAVTRAADNISIATSLLPFDATKGTLLAKVRPAAVATGSYASASLYLDGSNSIQLYRLTTSRRGYVRSGGVDQAILSSGSEAADTVSKSALSWAANDVAFSGNGGTIQTDVSASLPTPTTLYIGSTSGSSGHFEGWLQQLIYLPRDMSDAELVAWSTL